MNKVPKTEAELGRYLRNVQGLSNASDYTSALEACELLLADSTTRLAGLRARADVYADMRERGSELADREALIELGSDEPGDYFELGVLLWRTGRLDDAASAFSRSIKIGDAAEFDYYSNASRIHLAALLIKLGRRREALNECVLLPEAYSSYLPDGMVTKEQLMALLS